jgi:hypothetical protein
MNPNSLPQAKRTKWRLFIFSDLGQAIDQNRAVA